MCDFLFSVTFFYINGIILVSKLGQKSIFQFEYEYQNSTKNDEQLATERILSYKHYYLYPNLFVHFKISRI